MAPKSLRRSSRSVTPRKSKAGHSVPVASALPTVATQPQLTAEDLGALRSLSKPPAAVRRTCEALHCMLSWRELGGRAPVEQVDWAQVRSMLCSSSLQDRIFGFDVSELRAEPLLVAHLREHYFTSAATDSHLDPEAVRHACKEAGKLLDWMVALLDRTDKEVTSSAPPATAPVAVKQPEVHQVKMDPETELWHHGPSRGLPPGVCRCFVLATGGRGRSLVLARQLLPTSRDLMALVAVQGNPGAASTLRERLQVEVPSMTSRADIQPLFLQQDGFAALFASRAVFHYGQLGGLVIDSRALVGEMHSSRNVGSLPGIMLATAMEVFNALSPCLMAGTRVVVIASDLGVAAALRTSSDALAVLFQQAELSVEDLKGIAASFASEYAATAKAKKSLPCESKQGWWLDEEGFGHLLILALSLVWHRQQLPSGLAVCACACAAVQSSEVAEAQAATGLMVARGPPSDVAGQLFGNGAFPRPWISKDFVIA